MNYFYHVNPVKIAAGLVRIFLAQLIKTTNIRLESMCDMLS